MLGKRPKKSEIYSIKTAERANWVAKHLDEILKDVFSGKTRSYSNYKYMKYWVDFALYIAGREDMLTKSRLAIYKAQGADKYRKKGVKVIPKTGIPATHSNSRNLKPVEDEKPDKTHNMFDDAMESMLRATKKIDELTEYVRLLEEDNTKLKEENGTLLSRIKVQTSNNDDLASRIADLNERIARKV